MARFGVVAAALALCGCVEVAADVAPNAPEHRQFALRPGASLAQASVAILMGEGPPPAIVASFAQALESEARAREIAVVDETNARYLVRGFLSADLVEDGAAVKYVWDVFTADKQRVQRLSDVIVVKGAGDDPWAMVDAAALKSVAAKSADDLAAYLSNTPEAIAGGEAAAPQSYAAAQ